MPFPTVFGWKWSERGTGLSNDRSTRAKPQAMRGIKEAIPSHYSSTLLFVSGIVRVGRDRTRFVHPTARGPLRVPSIVAPFGPCRVSHWSRGFPWFRVIPPTDRLVSSRGSTRSTTSSPPSIRRGGPSDGHPRPGASVPSWDRGETDGLDRPTGGFEGKSNRRSASVDVCPGLGGPAPPTWTPPGWRVAYTRLCSPLRADRKNQR